MSYRSFKRVLGETSLERKCRYLFGAVLLLLITGSFWWYGQQTSQLVYKQNPLRGELLVATSLIRIHWEELEAQPTFRGIIPDLSAQMQRHQVLTVFLQPDALARPGQPAAWVDNQKNPVDRFEWDFIQRAMSESPPAAPAGAAAAPRDPAADDLEAIAPIVSTERFADGEQVYEYYQAIYATSSCMVCHMPNQMARPQVTAEGDLLAVAKLRLSNKPTLADLNWNRVIFLSAAMITVFLAMVASWVIVKYVIVKPLKHLRDVSDAVSHGDYGQRAEIHTADEFEELGVAFNRMLRHLVAIQEELQQANSTLDLKVDELAQVNMRLFEMNRLKSDFLATMSHELRTPLNSIIGFSDVLGSISSLDEKQKRYVLNIQKSGKLLLDMINDILDLAKIESGRMEVRLADFRIDQVVHAQCDMARPLAEKKNIDLNVDLDPRLPELRQDQGKVQQVLTNLLSNAIKFTPEGGRITVSARRSTGGDLLLTVADTGVGISEEDQTIIFEKFRQGDSTLPSGDAMTREHSGTGLGLSIVKELCKLLGGEVTLRSELGKGSEFAVRLPFTLSDQPRLDSSMSDTLEELTKPRRTDFDRGLTPATRSV